MKVPKARGGQNLRPEHLDLLPEDLALFSIGCTTGYFERVIPNDQALWVDLYQPSLLGDNVAVARSGQSQSKAGSFCITLTSPGITSDIARIRYTSAAESGNASILGKSVRGISMWERGADSFLYPTSELFDRGPEFDEALVIMQGIVAAKYNVTSQHRVQAKRELMSQQIASHGTILGKLGYTRK